jgi:hypothetical protein
MQNAVGIPLNCGVLSQSSNYVFKKPSIGGDSFKLISTPVIRTISASSSGTFTQKDLLLVQNSGSTTITDYQTSIQQFIPGAYYDISITSTNSGIILPPNLAGLASGISNGNASLIASSIDGSFSISDTLVSLNVGTTSINFVDYVTNSLAKHISNSVDTRIAGKTASIAKPIYSTQNHSAPLYIRNSGCWISDLDLTPISPWNSMSSNLRAGTLISKRHILFAAHYQIDNGTTIRFIDNNNNIVTRTMVNKLSLPYQPGLGGDITIGILNSDVPNTISFAKILPANWMNYLPNLNTLYRIPAIGLDQEEKALIVELAQLDTNAGFYIPDLNSDRYAFSEGIIPGDSGNPVFLIINGELVIITVWSFGGAGGGTNIAYYKDSINALMVSLGGGYTLTEIDLSNFLFFNS